MFFKIKNKLLALLGEKIAFKKSKIELSRFRRTVSTLKIRSTQRTASSVAALSNVLEKWDENGWLGKVACFGCSPEAMGEWESIGLASLIAPSVPSYSMFWL